MADPELVKTARALMDEVCAAASLEGHHIPDSFIQGQFTVTEKMGAYRPSSLIDFQAGKPVELDSIFWEPLRRGRELGAEMPELEILIKDLSAALTRP
jgi:2-dehydropantoate 2-reductase